MNSRKITRLITVVFVMLLILAIILLPYALDKGLPLYYITNEDYEPHSLKVELITLSNETLYNDTLYLKSREQLRIEKDLSTFIKIYCTPKSMLEYRVSLDSNVPTSKNIMVSNGFYAYITIEKSNISVESATFM